MCSLVNPETRIPPDITRLTGISNEMVENAPKFYEIAKDIIEWTKDATFVAHNVRFDYGFVKAAFKELGYTYQRPTLCTVRLSRKAFKGLPSYSLGRLCETLDIKIKDRHRALGDAEATAILLGKILENEETSGSDWLKSESKKTSIPPLLNEEVLNAIPEGITGVYYFHDKNGYVIYIGKAIDIKKRLIQHFSLSTKGSVKSMQMKNEIADISYEATGDELVALLLESDEIKKHRPIYNVAQKKARSVPFYGIYNSYDENGYICFSIKKLKEGEQAMNTADSLSNARDILLKMVERFNLCQSKCDLHAMAGPCFHYHLHQCYGACVNKEDPLEYNERAMEAIRNYSFQMESFLVIGNGRHSTEKSVVCVEKGQYKGFGFIDTSFSEPNLKELRSCIKPYSHNRDIQQIICTYLKQGKNKMSYEAEAVEI
ncbi:MAG: exonuclease domain-containing protein [Bacteroidia bacterium]